MKKLVLIVALIVASDASAAEMIKTDKIVGCRDYWTYIRIRQMTSRHKERGVAVLLREILAGNCIVWREGTPVRAEKRGVFTSCYARLGTKECYWTQNKQVERSRY